MACCGGKKKAYNAFKGIDNIPTHLESRCSPIRELRLNIEAIGNLFEKFQTFSTEKYGLEICEEAQFKDMIGILGNFYIGTRIFDVVLQLSRLNEKKHSGQADMIISRTIERKPQGGQGQRAGSLWRAPATR